MSWLRTYNGALNSRHVVKIYAYIPSGKEEWYLAADTCIYDPEKKQFLGYILNYPEVTVEIKNEIDARKAIDRLFAVLEIEE